MPYDLTKVKAGSDGMVQTSSGSFVNKDYLSDEGYAQAVNYQKNREPAVISSDQGRDVLNSHLNDHTQDISNSQTIQQNKSALPADTSTVKNSVKRNSALEAIGGVTSDEISASGENLNNYTYDTNSGYFIPKTNTQTNELNASYDTESKRVNDFYDSVNSYYDTSSRNMLDQYKTIFSERIADQKAVNDKISHAAKTTTMRTGMARYSPNQARSVLTSVENEGIDRLRKISMDESNLISQADQALQDKKFQTFVQKRQEIGALRKERQTKLEALQKVALDEAKVQKERLKQVTRDSAVADLVTQGVTDPAQLLNFLNYDESGNQTGDFTADELAKTLKSILPENKASTDLGADGKIFQFAKQQGWLPENASIFDYWKQEAAAKKSPTADKVGYGAGTPDDYKQFSRENIALSVIPTQLKNSEAEMTRLLSGIRAGLGAGKTPYEVADNLMGYMVDNPSAFSEGMRKYISIADLTPAQVGEMGRLINAGQNDKAISVIENSVYEKAKQQQGDKFVSEADVTYVKDKADEITNLLGEGWANEVGAFTGTFGTWLSKKFGFGQATAIKAKITNLAAALANKRGGSAITEEEWDRLIGPNIPSMNDNANTFKTKLQELVDDPLSRLNSERTAFSLPELTSKTLLNRGLRTPSYSSVAAFDPMGIDDTEAKVDENNPLSI